MGNAENGKRTMTLTSENLEVTTARDGSLAGIRCMGRPFSGFPGKIEVPEGVDVQVDWTSLGSCISGKFILRLKPGAKECSGGLKVLIPYPEQRLTMKVWSARRDFPADLDTLGGLHLYYGDGCYGTMIPAVTLYVPEWNAGLTVSKAFGRVGGRLSFHFGNYHETGVEAEFSCLALSPGRPVEIELLLRGHEGCWRPGLRWLADYYREYFEPPNPDVWKRQGAFAITNVFTDPEYLKRHRLQWSEIHNHFPHYGDYAPEEPEWESVVLHDYPALADEIPGRISPRLIRDHIRRLHDNGAGAMLYFQCGGDAYIPWAEKNFPDSIARDVAGNPIRTWRDCCMLNASADTSFGQFVSRRIDRFLKMYPEIDGVFLDQLCYQTLDYAHRDGRTAAPDGPAAEFGASYDYTLEKLASKIHAQHKVIWANGPFDIEVARGVDGVMSEGTSGVSESHKYLCIRKPQLVHTYPTDVFKAETMLRYCLLAGAAWSFGGSSTLRNPPEFSGEIQAVFSAYLPLLEPLLQAEILLEPAPLELPPGFRGEIFRSRDGKEIIVTLVGFSSASVLPVKINAVREGKTVFRGLRDFGWKDIKFSGGRLELPGGSGAYAVVIRPENGGNGSGKQNNPFQN